MSVKAMGRIWDVDVPLRDLVVLLALTDHADDDGGNMWPSLPRVAWKVGASVDTVRRSIRRMVKAGILNEQKRPGKTSVYSMNWDACPRKQPFDLLQIATTSKKQPLASQAKKSQGTPRKAMQGEPSIDNHQEKREHAPSELPDHAPQPDGGAKVYTLIEAWLDAWDIQEPRYRKGVHRTEGKHAGRMADMGATPDDIAAMCAERRSRGKQPDEAKLAFLASDFVAWKSRAAKSPPIAVVETTEQVTAREAQREAERREWRKEQGLA